MINQPQVVETLPKPTSKPQLDIRQSQQIRQYVLSYKRQRKVKALKVLTSQTNHYHKQLKKTRGLLDVPNLQKIIDSPPNYKIILVEKSFKIGDIQLPKINNQQQSNKQHENQNQNKQWKIIQNYQITLTYKQLSTQQLFDLFTSSSIAYPNSFQTVGHLAHYNLTQEQIPFSRVIGEITLMKCPNITCVVNKTQKLHNIYRTPTLQMIAGTKDYTVKLKQVGTQFQFDFEKVYWCSRLQQQRDRLLSKMQKGQLLADIFCGCGPLAVRAAKKGLYVLANDLNPYGYEYLVHNCKLNKVQDKMVCWNMCARQAMRKLYKQKQQMKECFQNPDHIYMNLPVDAIQFLDVFTNYAQDMRAQKLPLIHVNCFVVADTDQKSKELLALRIAKTLPGFSQQDILQMNHIKNVTIIMRMYCVTFRLRANYVQPQVDKLLNQESQLQQQKKGQKKIKLNQNV